MSLANFLRSLTDYALSQKTYLDQGHSALGCVRGAPCFEFRSPVGAFHYGFYDGMTRSDSRDPRTGTASVSAYENGHALGRRVRELRLEHGLSVRGIFVAAA